MRSKAPGSQRSLFQEEALCDVQELLRVARGPSVPVPFYGWDGVSAAPPPAPQDSEWNLELGARPLPPPFPMCFIFCLSALNILSQ